MAGAVLLFVHYAVLITTLYALVHAALQRPDAYTEVTKAMKDPQFQALHQAALDEYNRRIAEQKAFK